MEKRICLRCGHSWYPRKEGVSVQCPKCRSPYWNIPRKEYAVEDTVKVSHPEKNLESDIGFRGAGVTDNVPRRLSQLQAKSAYPLRIEHVYRVYEKAAILFESILHEAFGDCRTHGEWFRMTPDHVKVLDTEVPWVFSMKRVYRRSND
ncbi:unnamed protein product [Sphagnum balticum]